MPRPTKLDNPKIQQRILSIIRRTGSIEQGYKAGGISEATFLRYRQKHPDFDNLVYEAKQYFRVNRSIQYGHKIMEDAKNFLHEEILAGTCPHAIAYKIAYENKLEVLG